MTLLAPDDLAGAAGGSMTSMIIMIAVTLGIMYFIAIRPQNKREKETQEMRKKVDIGDEITTIGGIIGTVISLKEDTLVIETSSERNKIRIYRWAIQTNNTIHDDTPSEKKLDRKDKKDKK